MFPRSFILAGGSLLAAVLGAATVALAQIEGIPEANVIGTGCVDMELDYVPHVVACENGLASQEALKAQAVSARTYAYYQLISRGEIDDGQSDQVYSCGLTPQSQHFAAAAATACEILTYSDPPTSVDGVVSAHYVAGALADYIDEEPFLIPGSDPTNTERFVTYNWGLTGGDVQQTTLGFTTPDPLDFTDNRGCMSQNGAHTLSDNGWDYLDILRFYYGDDIEITTIPDCQSGPSLESCLPPDCNDNGVDDADDISTGESKDCNATGIPDECELDANDCNDNGRPDECDFARVIVYEEDFDAPVSWAVFSADGDYTAETSFDYAFHEIPSAPNSAGGTTRGLKFTVNSNDDIGATDAVSAYPTDLALSGDFRLEFDMWMNYNGTIGGAGSTGSTENAVFGVHHAGDRTVWPDNPASDGFWFSVTGEGGAIADYRAFSGATELSTQAGGFVAGGQNAFAGYYQKLFPGDEYETPGSPGKHWVRVAIIRTGDRIEWSINNTLIAARDDDAYATGRPLLGYMDTFPSISGPEDDNFVVYDNLRVTVLDDCNANGIVDACDLITGAALDCNDNDVPDACDLAGATSADCDLNAVPDECDVDCNTNDVPDACERTAANDCDNNLILDVCDLAAGRIPDCDVDGDGVRDALDDCAGTPFGLAVGTNGCPISPGGGVQEPTEPDTPGQDSTDDDDGGSDNENPADPRADSDHDGVIDTFDLCPDTPATVGSVDATGCPIAPASDDSLDDLAGQDVPNGESCGNIGCGAFGMIYFVTAWFGLSRLRPRRTVRQGQ